jgi:tetratricopeptide (TPR) repeat protein
MTQAHYLLILTLVPLVGCQLPSMEKLGASSNKSSNADAAFFAELPPKAKAEVCLTTAETMEASGNYLEAYALYERALQNGGPKAQITRRLPVLLDQLKEYAKALELYEQLLKHSPKDSELLNDVGYCYYNQGKWSEAEKYFREALKHNPKHARAWTNLGMTLAQTNRTTESLEAFAKVVSPAQAQCNVAFILTTQHKWEEAKAAYRKAMALEPNLALAQTMLVKLEQADNANSRPPVKAETGIN